MTNNSNDIFTYHTLANGLRIVHRASAADVEHCGVAIKAGSRNESSADYGLAHFVEHNFPLSVDFVFGESGVTYKVGHQLDGSCEVALGEA